jgi:D-alanine-D-alanine ligase-like ATP-grasp enzyme
MLHSYQCPDCGSSPVNHRAARAEVRAEMIMDQVFSPFVALHRAVEIFFAWLRPELLIPPVATILSWVGIAKKLTEPVESDTYRTRVIWNAARTRGIALYHLALFGQPTSVFVARYRGRTVVYTHEPRPAGAPSDSLNWMDNKLAMVERFRAAGIPVPRGSACHTEARALEIFHGIKGAAIAKPILGSRSRHTIIHITTDQQLLHAFHVAQEISPWVIIEEELVGMVYRATVIGGKLIGVLRREPPHVIGNGKKTIKQLIIEENKNPLRHGPIFHPLLMDLEAKSELKRQGLTWDSVPASGQMVSLNQKVGRGEGASNADVTDETHPENIKLFENIGAILADPLVGIDFIIGDITRPWNSQKACGVIECNAMPFIDLHHYPLTGKPRDAAGALWDIVFPETKKK